MYHTNTHKIVEQITKEKMIYVFSIDNANYRWKYNIYDNPFIKEENYDFVLVAKMKKTKFTKFLRGLRRARSYYIKRIGNTYYLMVERGK